MEEEFKVGDTVYCISLDSFTEENENWADSDHEGLEINVPYIVSHVKNDFRETGERYVAISLQSPCHYVHTSRRFSHGVKSKGDKDMPQVIATCDIGEAEKSIFQFLADERCEDVFIYSMEGKYYSHPVEIKTGTHIYFFSNKAYPYDNRPSGAPADRVEVQTTYSNYKSRNGVIFSCKRAVSDIVSRQASFDRGVCWCQHDLLTPIEDKKQNLARILAIGSMISGFFNIGAFPIEKIEGVTEFIGSQIRENAERSIKDEIESAAQNLSTYENNLIEAIKRLDEAKRHRIEIPAFNLADVLENLKVISGVNKINTMWDFGNSRLSILVETTPLIAHLPHGNIPVGRVYISLSDAGVTMQHQQPGASYWHPHFSNHPCWGGFAPLIARYIAAKEYGLLVALIMQWFDTYDGTGVYHDWGVSASNIGLEINLTEFLYGKEIVEDGTGEPTPANTDNTQSA